MLFLLPFDLVEFIIQCIDDRIQIKKTSSICKCFHYIVQMQVFKWRQQCRLYSWNVQRMLTNTCTKSPFFFHDNNWWRIIFYHCDNPFHGIASKRHSYRIYEAKLKKHMNKHVSKLSSTIAFYLEAKYAVNRKINFKLSLSSTKICKFKRHWLSTGSRFDKYKNWGFNQVFCIDKIPRVCVKFS